MKYLKLFESHRDEVLLKIVRNGLVNDKPEFIDLAVSKGFDLNNYRSELIEWCKKTANYNAIKYLDQKEYNDLVKNTTALDISNRNIKSLKGISDLTNLEKLSCYNNQIESLEPISGLTKLEKLYCFNNRIESLEPISGLTNLEHLYCSNNRIESLEPISGLTNLTHLHYVDNPVEVLELGNDIISIQDYYRNL